MEQHKKTTQSTTQQEYSDTSHTHCCGGKNCSENSTNCCHSGSCDSKKKRCFRLGVIVRVLIMIGIIIAVWKCGVRTGYQMAGGDMNNFQDTVQTMMHQ